MSMNTWKAEFYPVTADMCERGDAIAHSVRKWIGLRKKNLDKHNLVFDRNECAIRSKNGTSLVIDSDSCALCHFYANANGPSGQWCISCPLFGYLSDSCSSGYLSPYQIFAQTGNPEPMIKALRGAAKHAKQGATD